jgi:hypothetical protein
MKNSRKKVDIFLILRRVSFRPKFSFWLFLFIFTFLCSNVLAWTPPADPPPADNVPMPLNVGPSAQGKLGNLGIGTTEPGGYQLNVSGESYFTDIITGTSFYGPGGYYVSPGSTDWGLYTLGSVSATGTTNDNYFAGNLGIGTATPNAKLVIRQTGTDDIFNLYDTDSKILTVVDGGQVGIGVDTPTGLLDVAGSLVVSGQQVAINVPLNLTSAGDISFASDLQFTNPTASYIKSQAPLYIEAGDSNYSHDLILRAFNEGEVVVDAQMDLMGERITNVGEPIDDSDVATKGYIDNTGNWEASGSYLYPIDLEYKVGVGTDVPTTALDVYEAGASSEMLLKSDVDQKSMFYFEDGQTGIYEPASSEDLRFWVGSDDRMTITSDGKVGIGTTGPRSRLDIGDGDLYIGEHPTTRKIYFGDINNYFTRGEIHTTQTNLGLYNDWATGHVTLNTNAGEVVRVNYDGKVGINKIDPATALDVDGVITATDGTSTNWNEAYGWGDHSAAGYIEEVIGGTGLTDEEDSGIVTVNLSTPVSVAHGGTGATSLTANKLLVGAGTSAITSPTNLHWDSVNSRLGIGSATPNYTLDVNGTIYATGFYYDDGNAAADKVLASINDQGLAYWKSLSEIAGVSGSGTENYISKWETSGSLTDSAIYESSGKIGIGTTVPYENLNIMRSGAGNVARFGDNVSTKGLIIAIDSSGNPILKGTSSNQPMTITPDGYLALETDGVERVRILQSNGNIGIGTTVPDSQLHINNGLVSVRNTVDSTYQTPTEDYHLTPKGYVDDAVDIVVAADDYIGKPTPDPHEAGAPLDMGAHTLSGNSFSVPASGYTYFTSGNVGIGTLTPTSPLHVQGRITADNLYLSGGCCGTGIHMNNENLVAVNTIQISDPGTSEGARWIWGGTNATIDVAPYVDANSDGYLRFINDGGILLRDRTSGTGRVIVDTDMGMGIGIGDTIPSYTLDVSGTGRFTGNVIVASPGASNHAATKGYVDDNFTPITTTLTMTGTTNQVSIVPTGAQDLSTDRAWTFSLPQNIHTSATPQFARLGLGAAADSTYLLNLNGTKMHGTGTGIGIGTTIPGAYKLNVNGNVLASSVETTSLKVTGDPGLDKVLTDLDGAGTAVWKSISEVSGVTGPASSTDNAITRFDGTTGKIIQNSGVIIDDSGDVGIGTGSPITPLHVAGEVLGGNPFVAAHFSNTAAYYTGSGQGPVRISLGRVNNLHGYIEAGSSSDSNSANGYLAFGNRQNVNEINEVMRFDESGNVGVGTNDPQAKLDVNGNVEADNTTLSGRITSGTAHTTSGATINNATYQSGYGIYVGGIDDNYFAGNIELAATKKALLGPSLSSGNLNMITESQLPSGLDSGRGWVVSGGTGTVEEVNFIDGKKVRAIKLVSDGNSYIYTPRVKIDPNKTYKFSVWIKTDSTGTGSRYFGLYAYNSSNSQIGVLNSGGTENTNPYFWNGDPNQNKWTYFETYLYPTSSADAPGGWRMNEDGDYSGVIGSYKWNANTKDALIRLLNWGNSGVTITDYFYMPRIVEVGEGQSIADSRYQMGDTYITGSLSADDGDVTTDGLGNVTAESYYDGSYYLDPDDAGTALNVAGSINALGTTNDNYFAGNVGIGTTSPGAKIDVKFLSDKGVRVLGGNQSLGSTADSSYGVYLLNDNVYTANNAINYGIYAETESHIASNNTSYGVYGLGTKHGGYGIGAYGIYGHARHKYASYSTTSADLYGVYSLVDFYDDAVAVTSTGEMYNFYAKAMIPSSKIIDDYYGLYLATPVVNGTITNDRYGIYQQDSSADNYFAGNVGIGTTGPSEKLHVIGDLIVAGGDIYATHDGGTNSNNEYFSYDDGSQLGSGGTFHFHADSARNAAWSSPTAAISAKGGYFSGSVGIGTNDPQYKLDVRGGPIYINDPAETNDKFAATVGYVKSMTGGGTGGGVPGGSVEGQTLRWNNSTSAWNVSSNLVNNGTNVGIGDTSLTYKLEVNGEAQFDGALRARDATGIGFRDDAGNLGLWVEDGGQVGIGTTSPGQKLDVVGFIQAGDGSDGVQINYGTGRGSVIGAVGGAYNDLDLRATSGVGTGIYLPSGGNVGIGTTAPNRTLDVNGVFGVEYNGLERFGINPTSTGVDLVVKDAGGNTDFRVDTRTGQETMWYTGGNVGIGTTSPDYTLHTYTPTAQGGAYIEIDREADSETVGLVFSNAGTPDWYNYVTADANRSLIWNDGLTDLMTLTNDGYLGIGPDYTSPNALLDVNNKFLVSDSQVTVNVPLNLASAGDISFASDLIFTNSTSASIKSQSPLYITAGDASQNVDLTLRASNLGEVVVDDILRVVNRAYLEGGATFSGGLDMNDYDITGVDKLTVTTIDPIHEINGKEYATFVSFYAGGQKMETSGLVNLIERNKKEFLYILDFENLEEGSDLWLFWETIHQDLEKLIITLTPGFNGRAWYQKRGDSQIVIFGDQLGEVSYTLTAPRYDYKKWPNLISKTD